MSAHERTFACGRLEHEGAADDLPEQASFLAGDLYRAYVSGVEIGEIRDGISSKLDAIFPVTGRTVEGARFFSRANIELQRFIHDALEAILEDCFGDFHLNAMRNNPWYSQFYTAIRRATDTAVISELMKQAYEARQNDKLSVEEAEIVETPKTASSSPGRSGKKSGSKRAPAKEEVGDEELGIVADGIPF